MALRDTREGRRIGRWVYFHHPYNGPVWRLDGTTLDLEHDAIGLEVR